MRYVGMDIHSKTTTFCVIDDKGKICKWDKMYSGETGRQEAVEHGPGEEVIVALETGNLAWWVVDVSRGAYIDTSDKHDARPLADAFRGGLAP